MNSRAQNDEDRTKIDELKVLLTQGEMKNFRDNLSITLLSKVRPHAKATLIESVCYMLGTLPVSIASKAQSIYEEVSLSQVESILEVDVLTLFRVLSCLREVTPPESVRTTKQQTEWARFRARKARLWLAIYQKAELGSTSVQATHDLPQISVTPPASAGLPAGVAPEEVKDPAQRKEYELAIEKNRQKAKQLSESQQLVSIRPRLRKMMSRFLSETYSYPPMATQELQILLTQYVGDPSLRASILEGAVAGGGTK